jgi:NADPH:quinone reductase-like Zn-dependent oxidoreductase
MALWTNKDYQATIDAVRDAVLPAVASGAIPPVIHATLPLERAAEGLRILDDRAVFGKVVLTV